MSTLEMSTIGIIGGGQLALMMAEASAGLNLKVCIQTPNPTDPALQILAQRRDELDATVLAAVNDAAGTAKLAQKANVLTFENEFVDIPALQKLAQQFVCFRPPLSSLELVLDKFEQRSQLQRMGLPVPKFAQLMPSSTEADIGFPLPWVIKARRHGYDGQGTHIIRDPFALEQFWQTCDGPEGESHTAFMVEEFVPFERELAVIAARSVHGEIAIYPIVETYQPEQVCRWAIAPTSLPAKTQTLIEDMAHSLLKTIDYVGILGLELFLTPAAEVLVNELAPRTHNSGHLTIEAYETSQFTQHLLAVSGRNLGSVAMKAPAAVMVNLLGFENSNDHYLNQRVSLSEFPNAVLHWYHKGQSRVGRKMGHVTVLLNERGRAGAIAQQIEQIWYPGSQ